MTLILASLLTLALAIFALTRRRLLWGVVGVGAHSLALAGVFFLLSAPDVALTEAAIGFGLVTFVYLLAIRRTGKLVVVATPAYPLLYEQGEQIRGLEWEVLTRLAQHLHRDLELVWASRAEIAPTLTSAEAQLAAGGVILRAGEGFPSRALVPTRLVLVRTGPGPLGAVRGDRGQDHLPPDGRLVEGPEELRRALAQGRVGGAIVDLLRLRDWHLAAGLDQAQVLPVEEELSFHIVAAPGEQDLLQALGEVLGEMERTGELEELYRRYLA
jgi:uncharacterized MnhB-related membrane protein